MFKERIGAFIFKASFASLSHLSHQLHEGEEVDRGDRLPASLLLLLSFLFWSLPVQIAIEILYFMTRLHKRMNGVLMIL